MFWLILSQAGATRRARPARECRWTRLAVLAGGAHIWAAVLDLILNSVPFGTSVFSRALPDGHRPQHNILSQVSTNSISDTQGVIKDPVEWSCHVA